MDVPFWLWASPFIRQSTMEKNHVSDLEVDGKPINVESSEGGGWLSGLRAIVVFLAIIFSTLWNWDGFWQTNIAPLKNTQNSFFPAKYKEEQLKLSRIAKNNEVLDEIENRLKSYEAKSIEALERASLAKEQAMAEAMKAEEDLAAYLEQESLKCRYYDTSLRMIAHLTKKYSEDELKRTLSCTSKECEEILNAESVARMVCADS